MFFFLGTLQPQLIILDNGEIRYICPKCGAKYKQIGGINCHLKECGIGAKCPYCPKIVTQRRNLHKHMETHQRTKQTLRSSNYSMNFKMPFYM